MVYVDDIIITRNITRSTQLKKHSFSHFQTKDLAYLKYFLGIEVAIRRRCHHFTKKICFWYFGGDQLEKLQARW